jgi:plastocyanin
MMKSLSWAATTVAVAVLGALAVPSIAASTHGVSVKDDKFVASSLTISKGSAVRWVWKGHAPHNVTVVSGPTKFRAGTRTKGHFTHTFTKAGTYRIVCTIHAPDMRMTVKVK